MRTNSKESENAFESENSQANKAKLDSDGRQFFSQKSKQKNYTLPQRENSHPEKRLSFLLKNIAV